MEKSYLVIDSNGNAINRVMWDGGPGWAPRTGCSAIPDDGRPLARPSSGPAPTAISKGAFLARFTSAELLAIATAAQTVAAVNVWLITAQSADSIDLALPETTAGVDALVSAGLLTAARATAILTP